MIQKFKLGERKQIVEALRSNAYHGRSLDANEQLYIQRASKLNNQVLSRDELLEKLKTAAKGAGIAEMTLERHTLVILDHAATKV